MGSADPMDRYSAAPWIGLVAAVVSVLAARWFTDSLLGSLLVAVVVGLVFAGASAVLVRRRPSHDA